MAFTSNPGFPAVAFVEASATFILLILYWSLYAGSRARFLAYWIAGWTAYTSLAIARGISLWHSGPPSPPLVTFFALIAAPLFLASALEYAGEGWRLKYFWALCVVAAAALIFLGPVAKLSKTEAWAQSAIYCSSSLVAGWTLWRSQKGRRGFGLTLLSGAMLLRGFHAMDRPEWPLHSYNLLRITVQSVLGIATGVGMAFLIVEASRTRTKVLNEKLRRLALITTEATQSFNLDEALGGILRHLVESLATSKGFVFLLDNREPGEKLVLRASVGFSEQGRGQLAEILTKEPWVGRTLQRERPLILYQATADPLTQQWMQAEGIGAVLLVRVHGKDATLGVLGLTFSEKPHLDNDEEQFLGNVANLLGLTVGNISLFESAATSRRQWRDMFDSIEELIFVHGPDGAILRSNRPFSAKVNIDPAALIGRKVRDVLPRASAAWTTCPYCEGIAGNAETTDPFFGGYYLATDSAFCGSSGERLGTIHVLKDFTSRRQAENKFRNLFERGREGVFISTPEGKFLDFNGSFMRMLGYENRQDLLDADIAGTLFVNAQDRKRLDGLLKDFGEVTDFEFQFRRRDGEIRTGQESSFLTRDDSGAVVGYQGFLLDITDHKRAEFDIRRRNRELLALNAIAGLLSQSTTLEEGITGALLKVTKLFAADIGSVHLLDEPTRILKLCASIGSQFEAGDPGAVFEMPGALLDQIRQTRALLLTGSALPAAFRERHRREGIQVLQVAVLWAKDRVMGILVIGSREVREFSTAELNLLSAVGNQIATTIDKSLLLKQTREAYESLRHTQEQLLQSEKMAAVGQLISGVAHELNNPLTAILGYSQLLQSAETVNSRSADYVGKLYKQAQRTHRIVQSLLSFARQHKPERTSIQLNRIVEDTLALREYDMKRSGILIHREFDSNLPLTGGDFHQLQQVFLNILNNAVDAVNDNGGAGEIWIATRRDGDRLRVEFTDSGSGVKDTNRIFDPFYTTKPVGKGTGLGLSICYGIVKEHGGEIEVKNSPPRGATFTVILPLLQLSTLPQSTEDSQRQGNAIGKVLLIDAEEPVLQLEQELLLTHNVSVRTARNVHEGMHILQTESMDAVVMELQTPDQTSTFSLFSWIRQNRPELATRVIFTTSAPDDAAIAEIIQKTQCQLLTKPFDIDAFWESVRSILVPDMAGSSKN